MPSGKTWNLIRVFLSLAEISAAVEDRKDSCKLSPPRRAEGRSRQRSRRRHVHRAHACCFFNIDFIHEILHLFVRFCLFFYIDLIH